MSAAETTVPAEVVILLREALLVQLAHACEDAPSTEDEETRTGWTPILARIDNARSALDVIGWATPAHQQPRTLAPTGAVRDALHADRDTWRCTAQADHLESAEGRAQATTRLS